MPTARRHGGSDPLTETEPWRYDTKHGVAPAADVGGHRNNVRATAARGPGLGGGAHPSQPDWDRHRQELSGRHTDQPADLLDLSGLRGGCRPSAPAEALRWCRGPQRRRRDGSGRGRASSGQPAWAGRVDAGGTVGYPWGRGDQQAADVGGRRFRAPAVRAAAAGGAWLRGRADPGPRRRRGHRQELPGRHARVAADLLRLTAGERLQGRAGHRPVGDGRVDAARRRLTMWDLGEPCSKAHGG